MELTVQALDREIASSLLRLFEDQLAFAGVDDLTFRVHDRVVTISGTVPSDADIRSIVQLAADVPDVLAVKSELVTNHSPQNDKSERPSAFRPTPD